MTEERKNAHSGFRIKWADKETEYYGDSVQEVFKEVLDHIKNLPVQGSTTGEPSTEKQQETDPPTPRGPPAEGRENDQIVRNLDTPKISLGKS